MWDVLKLLNEVDIKYGRSGEEWASLKKVTSAKTMSRCSSGLKQR